MKSAWSSFTARIGYWAGLIGITLVVLALPFLIGAGLGMFGITAEGAHPLQQLITTGRVELTFEGSLVGAGIDLVLLIAASVLIGLGWTNVVLRQCYGEHPSWGDFFSPMRHGKMCFSYLASTILYGLIVTAGLALLVFPGLIWMTMFALYPYYVVRHKMGPIKALRASAKATYGAKWDLFGLLLILLAFQTVASSLWYVGLFLVWAPMALAQANAFKQLEAETNQPQQLGVPSSEEMAA